MKKIEYNQNDLSHVPKSIIYWVSQGVVIEGVRYSVKEFRVEEGNFKLIIEHNGEFFEVETSKGSGGSATIDPETLKGYLKTSDLGAGQGIDVRKLDSGVVVGLTDENTKSLQKVKTLTDNLNIREFRSLFNTYIVKGTPTGEADHTPVTVIGHVSSANEAYIDLDARNYNDTSLFTYLMRANESGGSLDRVTVVGTENTIQLPSTLDAATRVSIPVPSDKYLPGDHVVLRFDR